jgi:hypothetical protein
MMKTTTHSRKVATSLRQSLPALFSMTTLVMFFIGMSSPVALAQTLIYQYTNASSGAPNLVAAGLNGSSITRGAGLSGTALECTGVTQGFSADGFNTGTFANAQSNNDFFQFSITPTVGNTVSVTNIRVKPRQQNIPPLGPNRLRIAYSLDNGATFTNNGSNLLTSALPCSDPNVVLRQWNITGITGHTGQIIFRIYGFRQGTPSFNNDGDMTLTDLEVRGSLNCFAPVQFSITSTNATVCSTDSPLTIDLDGSQTGVVYTLRRNGVNTGVTLTGDGTDLSFTPSPYQTGTYTIVASNGPSCTTVMAGQTVLTVNTGPTAVITPANITVCSGTTQTLTASGAGAGGTYEWDNGAVTPTRTVSPTITTTYDITVTAANGCSDTESRTITVTNAPLAYNVIGVGINCTTTTVELDNSESGVQYTLLRNGVPLSPTSVVVNGTGSPISFGTYSTAGTYTVRATRGSCTTTMNGSVLLANGFAMNVSGPTTAECGNEIEVQVRMSGFCNMNSLQFSLNWNNTFLEYVPASLTMPSMGGSNPVLGQNAAVANTSGLFTFSWVDAISPCNGSLNANSSVMTLRFKAKGCVATNTNITITNVIAATCAAPSTPIASPTIQNLTVSVDDTRAPMLIAVLAPEFGTCSATALVPALSNFAPDCNTLTISPNTSQVFTTQGAHTATWTVSDGCGQQIVVSQSVNVADITPPSITCPADVTIDTEPGKCSAVYYDYANQIAATDDCLNPPMLSFSNGHAPSFDFPRGSRDITITATDDAGLTDDCVFSITVRDQQPPTITCPAGFTDYAAAQGCVLNLSTLENRLKPNADDNCPGETVTYTVNGGLANSYPGIVTIGPGLNNLVYRVTDFGGRTAECAVQINIVDLTPPNIFFSGVTGMTPTAPLPPNQACPNGITFEANSIPNVCDPTVEFTVVSYDNCNVATMTVNGAPTSNPTPTTINTTLTVGTHTYTIVASDGSAPAANCTFTIIVRDNQPPVLSGCSDITVNAGVGLCNATATWTPPTATDNCPGVTVTQIGGQSSGTVFQVGQHTITYRANDVNGRTATCSFMVTVRDMDLPVRNSCPSVLTRNVNLNASCATLIPDLTTASGLSATDACGTPSWVQSPLAGSAGPSSHNATTTVTVQARDASGNLSVGTCVFTITAIDNTVPTFNGPGPNGCPANRTNVPLDANQCVASNLTGLNASWADNCSLATVLSYISTGAGLTPASGTGNVPAINQFNAGSTIITYTLNDGANPPVSCSFTIGVQACARIRGNIAWAFNTSLGVSTATVTASPGGANDLTNASGNYSIFPASAGTYTLTPSKNNNAISGISAADANRIQNHVSGLTPYPNTQIGLYQRIASDLDGNGTLNTLDAAVVTNAISGDPESLEALEWVFISSAALPLTIPPSPALTWVPSGYPTTRSAATGSTNVNFVGIKKGDASVSFSAPLSPNIAPITFSTADRTLQAGEQVDVRFDALSYTDVAALQFGLSFDPAQLHLVGASGLEGSLGIRDENIGLYSAELGEVRVALAKGQGNAIVGQSGAFNLRFEVLESGKQLSEVLALNEDVLEAHVYNTQLAEGGVQLLYTPQGTSSVTDAAAKSGMQLMQNQPNPFDESTTIGFIMAEQTDAQLNIFDQMGRLVHTINGSYAAGFHTVVLDRSVLSQSGVYQYELVTAMERLTRKMVVFSKP